MKKVKEWLEIIGFIGLGSILAGGSILGLAILILASILITAGPIVLVIWVVWKLFF